MRSTNYQAVRIGVTVIVMWDKKILLARRTGSHGEGTWDTPGGHLEPGERVIDCALRETFEETNLRLDTKKITELGFTEDFFEDQKKHYISCVVACEVDGAIAKPRQNEPHKFTTEWLWFETANLPQPLFIPVLNALEKYK
jgi:8-oxo-dGTP diphosphatase